MLKAHRFHVKFTVHTIMSEGGDVTMEEDYTLSYRTEEWEPESPNNLKFSKTHIQGAQFQFASPYPNCKEAAYEHWIVREIVDGGLASKYAYFYLPTL